MHFGERHSQLLPFSEYVFGPDKSTVELQPDILDVLLLRKVYIVYMSMPNFSHARQIKPRIIG
jgi:hypothetical protein